MADEVDGPSYIDIHDEIEVIKAEGVSVAVENLDMQLLSESIFDGIVNTRTSSENDNEEESITKFNKPLLE